MVKRITSLKELSKLKLVRSPIEIQEAGGFYKARFPGCRNFVFDATAERAKQRLLSPIAKNLGIVPRPLSQFEKQLLEACR